MVDRSARREAQDESERGGWLQRFPLWARVLVAIPLIAVALWLRLSDAVGTVLGGESRWMIGVVALAFGAWALYSGVARAEREREASRRWWKTRLLARLPLPVFRAIIIVFGLAMVLFGGVAVISVFLPGGTQ